MAGVSIRKTGAMPASLAFERNVDLIAASAIRMVKTIEAAGSTPRSSRAPHGTVGADRPPGDGSPVGGSLRGDDPSAVPNQTEIREGRGSRHVLRAGVDGLVTALREAPDDVEALCFSTARRHPAILEAAAGAETTSTWSMRSAPSWALFRARPRLRSIPTSPSTGSTSCCAASSPRALQDLRWHRVRRRRGAHQLGPALDGARRRADDRDRGLPGGAPATSPDRRTRSTSHCGTRRRGRSHRRRRPARPLARRPTGALGLTTARSNRGTPADDGAGIGHPGQHAVRLDDDRVGVAESAVVGGDELDGVPVGRDRPATAQGVALDLDEWARRRRSMCRTRSTGRSAPSVRRRSPDSGFHRGGRGAPRSGAGSAAGRHRPSSRDRDEIAVATPAPAPACAAGAGQDQVGRVSGLEREAEAAVVEVDAGVRLGDPGTEAGAFDWMTDTPMPSPSTVHRYVVSPRSPGPCRCDDLWRSTMSARVDRVEQGVAVGTVVEDGRTVVGGGRGALDQDMGPLGIVRIVREADLGEPGAASAR